jgi:hypothetical protein
MLASGLSFTVPFWLTGIGIAAVIWTAERD